MMMRRRAKDRRKSEMSSGVCSPAVLKKMVPSSWDTILNLSELGMVSLELPSRSQFSTQLSPTFLAASVR